MLCDSNLSKASQNYQNNILSNESKITCHIYTFLVKCTLNFHSVGDVNSYLEQIQGYITRRS